MKPVLTGNMEELLQYTAQPLYNYGPQFENLMNNCQSVLHQLLLQDNALPESNAYNCQFKSLLLYGNAGVGKSSIAAHLAKNSAFPFIRLMSPITFINMTEQQKIKELCNCFEDAYRSPLSIIILDTIERLLDYVELNSKFSAQLLSNIRAYCTKRPLNINHRLLLIATTNNVSCCKQLGLFKLFNYKYQVPLLNDASMTTLLKKLLQNIAPIKTTNDNNFESVVIDDEFITKIIQKLNQTTKSLISVKDVISIVQDAKSNVQFKNENHLSLESIESAIERYFEIDSKDV